MEALITGGTKGIGKAICEQLAIDYRVSTFSRSTGFDVTSDGTTKWMESNYPPDILINNVGGGGRHGNDVMVKNVDTMIAFTQWAIQHMNRNGWGRVITISSIHGREFGSRPIFMAAKAAQIAYMKGMSRSDYVRHGVTFNTVCPGNVKVDGKPDIDSDTLPMRRMGKPDEVAKLVAFICASPWINGSTITIDGGESYAI